MNTADDPAKATDEASGLVARYREIANAAMTDAEAWLRQGTISLAIPDAIPDAILVVDERGIIISVNAQFELMFGYHRSEVIGNMPEMLLPEAARASHVEQRRAFGEHPSARNLGDNPRLVGRRKSGSEFRVLVKLNPVVIPAGVHTIVVIRRTRE